MVNYYHSIAFYIFKSNPVVSLKMVLCYEMIIIYNY